MKEQTLYSFADALKYTIEANLSVQQLHPTGYTPIHYAREFKTVRLDFGRRTGKTQAIKQLANEDDLIIVGNHQMKIQFEEDIFRGCLVIYQSELKNFDEKYLKGTNRNFRKVFVDNFSFMHQENCVIMYSLLSHMVEQFILVG